MTRKITIHGSYGTGNRGDNVILLVLLAFLHETMPFSKVTVLCRNEERLLTLLEQEKSFPSLEIEVLGASFRSRTLRVLKACTDCDLFILGGGGILWGGSLRNLLYWSLRPLLASLRRAKIVFYLPGIFSINNGAARWILKGISSRADFLSVRDLQSRHLLIRSGIDEQRIRLGADPAFLVSRGKPFVRMSPESLGFIGKRLIGISARDWGERLSAGIFNRFIANLLEDPEAHIVFFAFQTGGQMGEVDTNDLSVAANLQAALGDELQKRVTIVGEDASTVALIELIGACEFFIGMRLHSLIFATIAGTPYGAVTYDEKVVAYMHMVGREKQLIAIDRVHEEGRLAALANQLREERMRSDLSKPLSGLQEIGRELTRRSSKVHVELANALRTWFPD